MNVEYTGRQFEITPAIRKEVESGPQQADQDSGRQLQEQSNPYG